MSKESYYYAHMLHVMSGRIFVVYSKQKYATELWSYIQTQEVCEFIEKTKSGEFLTLTIKADAIIAVNNPWGTTERISVEALNKKRENEIQHVKKSSSKSGKIKIDKPAKPT